MPMGDPAGYLPRVKQARKKKGQALYQPKPGALKKAGGKLLKPAAPAAPKMQQMQKSAAFDKAASKLRDAARRKKAKKVTY